MEDYSNYLNAIEKIEKGEQFGLFEDGNKCYFQDGAQISPTELWIALKIIHNLPPGLSHKTLSELCPDTFIGTFPYKFSKCQWEGKDSTK